MLDELKRPIERLDSAITKSLYYNKDLSQPKTKEIKYLFKTKKHEFYRLSVDGAMDEVHSLVWDLTKLYNLPGNKDKLRILINLSHQLEQEYSANRLKDMLLTLSDLKEALGKLQFPEPKPQLSVKLPRVPLDIRDEVVVDLKELERCYNSGFYRGAVILCGKVLEIVLHRKYYERTGTDILEKNPGIGLGKLVAKLNEKGLSFDPGLTQQIHLINQVRIFSVHKKQNVFYPTREQAHAIILYTMDIIQKMF